MTESETFHLCLGCGTLKSENDFRDGSHQCNDCIDEGRDEWRDNPDGDGFVRRSAVVGRDRS